ncbi:hypothetical protein [Segatella copri]|uniref:Uncharacterized protein n=1 Tax=Segatella copri TaxID=165179 RepID=A0AAW5HY90_9BACT|nr:hypothetical protein [Segatella copri]MCF0066578.1 hypothetical protein [Segatella copri]MCP9458479.1 hypothetical protein [Segatella copri]MCP9500932.1 hypothetical protein [Segatella copri]MCP9505150.1 hypothetical protein [Segatella copri]MCP9507090.1 hypothetical protein [Segatella copri]
MSANLYFIFGNAKLLREIWGEFTNNGLFLLIIIHGTGDGIAWNGGRRGTEQKTKEREVRKREERKKGGKKKGREKKGRKISSLRSTSLHL